MSADIEAWRAHSAGLRAEVQRLEALVVTRTTERDTAIESGAAWAQTARDLSASCEAKAAELTQQGMQLRAVQDELLHTQGALAASQAALTRVRTELADTRDALSATAGRALELKGQLVSQGAELVTARAELDQLRRELAPQAGTNQPEKADQ